MENNAKAKKKETPKAVSLSKNHYTNNTVVRLQRNQAEKQRRDRLNDQIAQLASIVPTAVSATKPLDKVSILRLAASWMRLNYSCLNAKRFKSVVENYLKMHYSVVSNLNVIEKSINGFIMATTFDGVLLMCSRYVEDYIGYQNIDLLGNSIFNYILEKEKDLFEKKIRNLISKFKNGSSKTLRNIFRAHMQQRPLPRTNDVKYRKMSFSLTIHSGSTAPTTFKPRKRNIKIGKEKDFGENAVILIFVEPIHMEPDLDVMYLEEKDCYFTIHGPQGEIMFADHRISIVTGYMPRDVLGNSAYQYIHSSDVPIALFAQKAMFASSDGTGIITYRLRILDLNYIYLQTKGQIRYTDSSKEIRQFVCCNLLLSEADGSRELKKFQERFAPQLSASEKVKHKLMKSKNLSISPPTDTTIASKQKESTDLNRATENILETLSEICSEFSMDTEFVGTVLVSDSSVDPEAHNETSENQTEKSLNELSAQTNQFSYCDSIMSREIITQTTKVNVINPSPPTIVNPGFSCDIGNIEQPFQNFIQNETSPGFSSNEFRTTCNIPANYISCDNKNNATNLNYTSVTTDFLASNIDLNSSKHNLSNSTFVQQTPKRSKLGKFHIGNLENGSIPQLDESALLQETSQLPQISNGSLPVVDQLETENDRNFSFINDVIEKLIFPNPASLTEANDPLLLPLMNTSVNPNECPVEGSCSKSLLNLPDDIDLGFLDQAAADNLLSDINGLDQSETVGHKIYCDNSYAETLAINEKFPSSLASRDITQSVHSYPQSIFQNYGKQSHSRHLKIDKNVRGLNSSHHSSLSANGLKDIPSKRVIGYDQILKETNFVSDSYSEQSSNHNSNYLPHSSIKETITNGDPLNLFYSQSNLTDSISAVPDPYDMNSCFSTPESALCQVELDSYYDINCFPLTNNERSQTQKKV